MKKSVSFLLLLACFTILLSNCKKKKDDPSPTAPTKICTNNAGTKNSYLPNTTGTFWKYKGGLSYTSTVGCDTTMNGITYTGMTSSKSTAVSYFRKSGGDYSNFSPNGKIYKMTYLKDAAEGTTWINNYPNLVYYYDYQYRMKIDSTNLTKFVNGSPYTNVIKVSQEIYIDVEDGFGYQLYETDYYYYAYGIGLILSDLESYGQVYLDSYSIK
jgi:hypothetical protein